MANLEIQAVPAASRGECGDAERREGAPLRPRPRVGRALDVERRAHPREDSAPIGMAAAWARVVNRLDTELSMIDRFAAACFVRPLTEADQMVLDESVHEILRLGEIMQMTDLGPLLTDAAVGIAHYGSSSASVGGSVRSRGDSAIIAQRLDSIRLGIDACLAAVDDAITGARLLRRAAIISPPSAAIDELVAAGLCRGWSMHWFGDAREIHLAGTGHRSEGDATVAPFALEFDAVIISEAGLGPEPRAVIDAVIANAPHAMLIAQTKAWSTRTEIADAVHLIGDPTMDPVALMVMLDAEIEMRRHRDSVYLFGASGCRAVEPLARRGVPSTSISDIAAVTEALNGDESVTLVVFPDAQPSPDLMLQLIRTDGRWRDTSVVMVVDRITAPGWQRAWDHGADAVVPLGSGFDDLATAIEGVRARAQRRVRVERSEARRNPNVDYHHLAPPRTEAERSGSGIPPLGPDALSAEPPPLPLGPNAMAAIEVSGALLGTEPEGADIVGVGMVRRAEVMIVDPDPYSGPFLMHSLIRRGIDAVLEPDALVMLERLRAHGHDRLPRLVLVHAEQRGMSGLTVVQQMRSAELLGRTESAVGTEANAETLPEIWILSGSGRPADWDAAFTWGAGDVVPIPFDPVLLAHRITRALAR